MATLIAIILCVYAWLIYEMHNAPIVDEDYDSDDDDLF